MSGNEFEGRHCESPTGSAALLALLLCATAISCNRAPARPQPSAADDIRGQPINSPVPSQSATSGTPARAVAVTQPEPAPAPSSGSAGQLLKDADQPLVLGFDKLASFTYEMPDDLSSTNQTSGARTESQIPKEIFAFDKKSVALKGFMLPLKVEGGLVTEMLIMRDQSMCCYGTVPKINEWVSVKMSAKGVKPIMDQPVTLFGTLHVGEIRENGYLVGIYQMDGEKMAGPLDM